MNGFDIALLVLLGLLVVVGVLKGLTRILIGIGALVAAFVLAAQFHATVAGRLEWIDLPDGARELLAYLGIFLGTLLAGALLAFLLRKLLKAAMLGWADRLAGAALGVIAALLIGGLIVLPLVAYLPSGDETLRGSMLAPYVTIVADVAKELVPQPLADRYRERVEGLKRYWSDRWAGRADEQTGDAGSPATGPDRGAA